MSWWIFALVFSVNQIDTHSGMNWVCWWNTCTTAIPGLSSVAKCCKALQNGTSFSSTGWKATTSLLAVVATAMCAGTGEYGTRLNCSVCVCGYEREGEGEKERAHTCASNVLYCVT